MDNFGFGGRACGWSKTAKAYISSLNAETFYFVATPSDIYASNYYNNRTVGHPVRCLVYKFSFVRSGSIYLNYGSARNLGINGYGWSSIASTYSSLTSANAYLLSFNASSVNPSGNNVRWLGFPVRCLGY